MDLTMSPPDTAPVRSLTTDDLSWALAEGWSDFKAKRGDLILLPFIYPLVGVLASVFAFNTNLMPLIFPLAAGFALVGPIAAAGFYEIARRREARLDASWWHFLDPLKGRSRLPIAMLTFMLAAIFLAWMGAAQAIYSATLGTLAPADTTAFLRDLFGTPQGLTLIVVGNMVGALFAVVTLALSAFSFPMVVDKSTTGVDASAAVATSVRAFLRSPVVMIGWGIRVGVILLAAAVPLFVGLMIALPVLGYATWHLYSRAVER
ncbi:DUF2189 domain-containing protein [Polymorphobacter fuscus]|uniref:DUF2189 domain-containing protein n=1 Tax=Sandarakinorhabdus fusca TaxID=1439888 RepID=A0A7C9KXZ0_9SPHN|nr:DUF2189 domain-containing protein [Polymorphobacter fuscus]KAB7645490.1 DUF2189 domain-containing protein [Polymorphobacter fuscus]MQT17922.1 DUF2189 domain-containing protein [Polymorphobacter fuscus]NJC08552.1 putative membrane protein [Polymorphobacter fuscus]